MTRHPLRFKLPLLAAASAAIALGLAAPVAAQMVLGYSPWNAPGYVVNKAVFPWMDRVKEVTEGRVVVESRAAAVGAPREQAEVVRDGLVDVSLVVPGYTPGRYPLLELGELPLISESAALAAPAIATIYERYFDALKPFEGAHVLSAFNVAPAHLVTIKAPLAGLEDVSGLKLYISNRPTSAAMTNLGAVPVSASVAETFSMASTGVIDGAVFPFEPTISFGLESYFRNYMVVPGGLGQAGMVLIVNQAKWDSISQEDRAAIMAISGPVLAAEVGAAVAQGELDARHQLEVDGASMTELSADILTALREQVQPIYLEWVAKAERAGLANAAEVLAEYQASAGGGQ